MEYAVAAAITIGVVLLPLIKRIDLLVVLGALAFGWVLNDITGNELMLVSRSFVPGVDDSERFVLLVASFLPVAAAIIFAKRASVGGLQMVLSLGLTPAIFVTAWNLVRVSLPYDSSRQLVEGSVGSAVYKNQEYAIWAGVVLMIMLLYFGRSAKKETKKSKNA